METYFINIPWPAVLQKFQWPRFRWLISVWIEISSIQHNINWVFLFYDNQLIQNKVPIFGVSWGVDPVCFFIPFFGKSSSKVISLSRLWIGILIGLCVCILATGFNVIRHGVEIFPYSLRCEAKQCLISTKYLQSCAYSESLTSENWKRSFFRSWKFSLKYGEGRNTRGANFRDDCTLQTVLLKKDLYTDQNH